VSHRGLRFSGFFCAVGKPGSGLSARARRNKVVGVGLAAAVGSGAACRCRVLTRRGPMRALVARALACKEKKSESSTARRAPLVARERARLGRGGAGVSAAASRVRSASPRARPVPSPPDAACCPSAAVAASPRPWLAGLAERMCVQGGVGGRGGDAPRRAARPRARRPRGRARTSDRAPQPTARRAVRPGLLEIGLCGPACPSPRPRWRAVGRVCEWRVARRRRAFGWAVCSLSLQNLPRPDLREQKQC
jgi:hypothetical protein